jgi:hypothetical protein
MRQDARWLVGHHIRRINHLRLQTDLLVHMLAVLDLQGFPGLIGHNSTPVSF